MLALTIAPPKPLYNLHSNLRWLDRACVRICFCDFSKPTLAIDLKFSLNIEESISCARICELQPCSNELWIFCSVNVGRFSIPPLRMLDNYEEMTMSS